MTRIDRALHALCTVLRSDVECHDDPPDRLEDDTWFDLIVLANQHRLGPALFSALAGSNRFVNTPCDVHAYLGLLHRQNGKRNAVIRQQAIDLVAALNSVGIRPLLLKGILALLVDRQSDRADRMMADIDFAVAPEARHAAERVLEDLGYRVRCRYPDGHHAVAEFGRAGLPAAVDLHIELIDQRYVLPAGAVFARGHRVSTHGVTFVVPAASDRLLHALLHAQIHHLGQYYLSRISLAQLFEFCRLSRHPDIGPDAWESIDTRLCDHRLVEILDGYLIAANELFAHPWPLRRSPLAGADRQLRRWRMQLRLPVLTAFSTPAGNLSAAFALYRMRALYGTQGSPAALRLKHARQYLQRHNPRQLAGRLFRGLDESG